MQPSMRPGLCVGNARRGVFLCARVFALSRGCPRAGFCTRSYRTMRDFSLIFEYGGRFIDGNRMGGGCDKGAYRVQISRCSVGDLLKIREIAWRS